ncbi:ferrous iron transport protein B [Novipirellula artificiosorum]|uniref:Ferrous iron transport protein B n=1 Tax=Novipirellula artificiosorum TaxID=2528016 RepID=A0A5C6CWG4_9BACT|nr:ferrous iron transport protein B [Novipirellula artificiosorum]TWU28738.1 Ferrous iron transport protein B [Novipirellula artificiosorum]
MKFARSPCDRCPANPQAMPVKIGTQQVLETDSNVDLVVALGGNPNTGKSTVFNALTGLRQHTGNWPGKTVARAEGSLTHQGLRYRLVDLPGTYSLMATSYDEEIARDFLLFGRPDVTVVVVDATRLDRNLNLALQVLEITDRVVLCLNLMDEARRHGLTIDVDQLSEELGVPVVPTSARFDQGLDKLLATIHSVATGKLICKPVRIQTWSDELRGAIEQLTTQLCAVDHELANAQWVALRLLDGDERVAEAVRCGELVGAADSITAEESRSREQILKLASSLRWQLGAGFHDSLVETIFAKAGKIADATVTRSGDENGPAFDRKLDQILTSRWTGFPVMILLLAVVLWLTIAGANVPSAFLFSILIDTVYPQLKSVAATIGMPWWLSGVLIDGVYLATAWVISVMLPPMAIFFPLFTLLEDFGYLPRVAFNLDHLFKRAGGHGKQALTMCMGLGCNAAGVIATRIIESPRERLIAIISNNFALCNGRWPTQILLATIFFGALVPSYLAGLVAATAVLFVALLGVLLTFVVSWLLSRTVLQGEASIFHLELPPYRPPRLLQTLYTSLIDRTIFVLWRAIVFAAPAGAVIWLTANLTWGDASLAEHLVHWLDPLGVLIGLNGIILLAYFIAIPANEIVIPTILMLTVLVFGMHDSGKGAGVMFELESTNATKGILEAGGWTVLTAVNVMLFSLVHNPCSTTIYTIWKETRSMKWTVLATFLPLAMGVVLCYLVAQIWNLTLG